MTATSIIMICFGILIVASRGPLIFAPGKTRDTYLRWIGSDQTLRVYGIVIGVLAMLVIWSTRNDVGMAAQLVHGFGWFIAVMCAVVLIPFPGPVGRMGTAIWGKFSEPVLRALGVLSVLVGVALVYFALKGA
jgi:hypothetical protein